MDNLVNLHTHTFYSLLDGLNSPMEIFQTVADLGQHAISITDHGTVAGHRDAQQAAQQTGIKPLLGLEAYFSETDRFDRRTKAKRGDNTNMFNHLVLIAKNDKGLRNLNNMSRVAWTEGVVSVFGNDKPRIDFELLEQYGDDLICLSGCLNSVMCKALESDDYDKAVEWADRYRSVFGQDFYVEVQAHNPDKINDGLLQIADSLNLSAVASTDSHYTRPELKTVQESLLILSMGGQRKRDKTKNYANTQHMDMMDRLDALYPDRPMTFRDLPLYIMTRDEIEREFQTAGITRTDIFDNTLEIADKVDQYTYVESDDLLPRPVDNPDQVLRDRIEIGLQARGIDNDESHARIEEELSVIEPKQFSPYFLIVENAVSWARDQGIRVGPARGSAAGSLVCYALGITDVNPLEHGLLFFRFIDPSRDDWPDIDIDFQKSRRSEVKEYLRNQYGHVASISNYIYFQDKGVVKDAARVLAVPLVDVNKLAKQFDTWDEFVGMQNTKWFRDKYPDVVELARNLRGRIRGKGLHAAGMVTSSKPIENYAPFETVKDPDGDGRIPVVAWDMDQCADIGLIKLDFLGLKELDVIDDAVDQAVRTINDTVGQDGYIDLNKIDYNDPAVYADLAAGHTVGTFQAHATASTNLLIDMQVSSFDQLVASNALVRPGAANTVGPIYIRRMRGEEPVTYVHDIMRPYLEETYGTIVFQEQVMQAATELGHMTHGEANRLRKIIGKKKDPREFDQYKQRFIDGASQHISVQQAEQLWHDFEAHAGYSFNKSHSVAYSMLTYQTAWLKHYYPLEFMAASFKNEKEKNKRTELFIEMRRLGLRVLLPHVNKSDPDIKIEGNALRLGLTDIKYISDKVFKRIDKHRPFDSYAQLVEIQQTKYSGVNKNAVEALTYVGAVPFDDAPDEDITQYMYEYLGVPKFKAFDVPARVDDLLVPIEDTDDEGAFVVRAIVTKVKRGKGWALVDLLDESGTRGVFHDEDTEIESGQMYYVLIGQNRVMSYITGNDLEQAVQAGTSDDPFVVYLLHPNWYVESARVIARSQRKTKAGKLMGTAIMADIDRQLTAALIFPSVYGKLYGPTKPGSDIEPILKTLDDGGTTLLGVQ